MGCSVLVLPTLQVGQKHRIGDVRSRLAFDCEDHVRGVVCDDTEGTRYISDGANRSERDYIDPVFSERVRCLD